MPVVLDPCWLLQMKAVLETHVNDIATHVTEVYIDQVMKDSRISRTVSAVLMLILLCSDADFALF